MPDITSNLAIYLTLDQSSGSTATDSSGLGNDVSLSGSPTWGPGKFSNGLQLNGSSQYGALPDVFGFPTSGTQAGWQCTFACWFKFASGTPGILLSQLATPATPGSTPSGGYVPCLYFGNDGRLCGMFGWHGHQSVAEPTGSYNDGTWHHVALVCDSGDNTIIYVDGTNVGSIGGLGGAQAYATAYTYILGAGYSVGWPDDPGNGSSVWSYSNVLLDEVRVYQRGLSSSDVAALYAFTPSGPPPASGTAGIIGGNVGLGILGGGG